MPRAHALFAPISAAALALAAAAPVWVFAPAAHAAHADDPAPVVRYDGHRGVRAQVRSPRDMLVINQLTTDIWSHRPGRDGTLDFRVSPEAFDALKQSGVRFTVIQADLQAAIEAERAQIEWAHQQNAGFYDTYHTYEEIKTYIQNLAAAHPDKAQFIIAGQSLEGRDIFGIRFTGPGSTTNRPIVYIEGCQHAREWITPATTTYVVDRLLTDYATDPRAKALVDSLEFIFIPIVNPDGYVYTWGPDRMWRKNRRPNGDGTFGVDLNRNWGYQWGGEGSSGQGFSETYRGPSPFSEPETKALRDLIVANPRIKASIDFHSYGQLSARSAVR